MISHEIREIVRCRANFSCEYCGVSETEAGGELTIDHFKPQSKGGSDEIENLIYACSRCNLYKSDYFSENDLNQKLWNPRTESSDEHFILLTSGHLQALTKNGEFTIRRLRLNRNALVENHRQKQIQVEENLLTTRYQTLTELLMSLSQQQFELLEEQQKLLEAQQRMLKIFFDVER
jgi:HNH endonuclease